MHVKARTISSTWPCLPACMNYSTRQLKISVPGLGAHSHLSLSEFYFIFLTVDVVTSLMAFYGFKRGILSCPFPFVFSVLICEVNLESY